MNPTTPSPTRTRYPVDAAVLALLLTTAAFPGWSFERMQPQPMQDATGELQVLHTRLRAVAPHQLDTDAGSFLIAPGCERFLRRGDRLLPVRDLGPYVGSPLSLRIKDGQIQWAVVESREARP